MILRWLTGRLDAIVVEQRAQLKLMEKIMDSVSALEASVKNEDTVIDSAMVLLKGLKDRLDAAGTDPAKLDALKSDIDARAQALAAAVAANTPADPASGGSSSGSSTQPASSPTGT